MRIRIKCHAAIFIAGVFAIWLAAIAGPVEAQTASGVDNVAISGEIVYGAAGPSGLVVHRLTDGAAIGGVAPPAGTSSIDDVAVAGELLFTLDASRPGALSVYSLADPAAPRLVAGPVAVDVGPFAGVSAAGGIVAVSGGTGRLSAYSYDATGSLSASPALTDLGIGQPDILLAAADGGAIGFVSTDFMGRVDGVDFGLSVIAINRTLAMPTLLGRFGIPGSGFTAGARQPANFPVESAVFGDTLYVAHGGGISVFDVTAPAQTSLRATIDPGFPAVNIDADGDILFVVAAAPAARLAIIDVSDASAPQLVQSIDLSGGDPTGVAVSVSHIAIADARRGVMILPRP